MQYNFLSLNTLIDNHTSFQLFFWQWQKLFPYFTVNLILGQTHKTDYVVHLIWIDFFLILRGDAQVLASLLSCTVYQCYIFSFYLFFPILYSTTYTSTSNSYMLLYQNSLKRQLRKSTSKIVWDIFLHKEGSYNFSGDNFEMKQFLFVWL